MNKLNIQQTGGFPLTTNTLDFMQASLLLMQEFGNIAGDLTIIRGCEVIGTQVNSGAVFINGEILEFIGGTLGTKVIIQETRSQKQFEDGSPKDVEIKRIARFGNDLKSYAWSDFTRITPIKVLQKALTPVGLISMWSGSVDNIPEGWYLCNGQNGTPNLTNKFVRGGTNAGHTGGQDNVTLQEVNMPPHSHAVNLSGSHSHDYRDSYMLEAVGDRGGISGVEQLGSGYFGTGQSDYNNKYLYYRNNRTQYANVNINGNTEKKGGLNGQAQPFDNRPAFYTLAFIMFKGE